MTRRVQQRRSRGWRKPPDAVSVARPGRWGNPHRVDELGRAEAVARYRADLYAGRLPYNVDDVRRELAGRTLMCWCPLGEPCHGDVLAEVANTHRCAGCGRPFWSSQTYVTFDHSNYLCVPCTEDTAVMDRYDPPRSRRPR